MSPIDYDSARIRLTNWQDDRDTLSRIRRAVFIDEQGVGIADEWDGRDTEAIHWLAFDLDNQPVGTARLLPDGQVGRMAVLASHRGQGVGSALLRQIIAFARKQGLSALTLHAQLHAIPLYQRQGFELTGEEFEDASLPHRPMQLDLERRSTSPVQPPAFQPPSSEISGKDTDPRHCAGYEALRDGVLDLVRSARREVLVFSSRLLPEVFDHDAVTRAVAELCLEFRQAEVLLLVRDLDYLSRHHHRLVTQQQRMPSRVSLRCLDPSVHVGCNEFLQTDTTGLLEFYGQSPGEGLLLRHAPHRAAALRREFMEYWNMASPDPNLRRLRL